jgi:hypothetical protein
MQNIVQNAQARSLSNREIDTKSLARCGRVSLKRGADRVGEIIVQESSGSRVIAELSSPVHETLGLFVDYP